MAATHFFSSHRVMPVIGPILHPDFPESVVNIAHFQKLDDVIPCQTFQGSPEFFDNLIERILFPRFAAGRWNFRKNGLSPEPAARWDAVSLRWSLRPRT
jgi:hypothetical protein